MKRNGKRFAMLSSFIISAALISQPLTALAGAPEDKPVQVFLEQGGEVAFDKAPFIEDGSTLVQFRPVFEKLGLQVGWDDATQTVTGTAQDVEIKLQIGNPTATVNGKAVELAVAPRIVGEYTFVPLRFVGEASGLEVGWDGYGKAVLIGSMEFQAAYAVGKSFEYFALEDLEGYLSAYDENAQEYPLIQQSVAAQLAAFDIRMELKGIEVLERPDEDHAVVRITKDVDVLKGPELKDYTMVSVMPITKVNGEWKLSIELVEKQVNQVAPEWVRDDKPVVGAEEEKAIKAALEQFRVLSEKEDIKGMQAMTDPSYPNLAAAMMATAQMAAAADFSYQYEDVKLIQYKEKEVLIRYSATMTKLKGPDQIPTIKTDVVDKWIKNDKGAWLLAASETVSMEFIRN